VKPWRLDTPAATAFGILTTATAAIVFWSTTHQLATAVFTVCPGIAFTALLWLGSNGAIEHLKLWIHDKPARIAIVPAFLWLLYLVYATGMGIANGRSALGMALYVGVPFLGFSISRKCEPLVILWLWLPLEFGIIRDLLMTHQGAADARYVFGEVLALDIGIVAFAVWNGTPGIGYRVEANEKIVANGVRYFLLFATIAIPLGLAIRFIQYNFAARKLYAAPLVFLGVFFFTALPEEFLFRGLIQNWIERTTKRKTFSLIAASIIFGASHLNNGPPVPNYKYFLMAAIAGLFYGRSWQTTASLMSSSLTHALVDTVWTTMFR
jgi:membrane protease YdiL (CAAX protease family)